MGNCCTTCPVNTETTLKKPKSKFFRKKCLPKRRFKAIIRKSVLIQKQIARFDITNAELGFVSH
jgi:hypothetical protein